MLNATPGHSQADSYLALATADSMAAAEGLTAWALQTEAQRETALRHAARDIDSLRFHDPSPWKTGQARVYPRAVDNGSIPSAVQWAQLYQAEWIAVAGESERKSWEGAGTGPLKDAHLGAALCGRAFALLAKLVARSGEYEK